MDEQNKHKPADDSMIVSPESSGNISDAKSGVIEAASDPTNNVFLQRAWWVRLFLTPLLLLASVMLAIVFLGVAQRIGWLSQGSSTSGHAHQEDGAKATRYICPMMCTPPLAEPGRCPVCGMELVPMSSDFAAGPQKSIQIEPAARRIANITTVPVVAAPFQRTVHAVGEISYDEGKLKTIAAYVDGRIEQVFADYTGVVVRKNDRLARLYSPRLYTAQVELILARKAMRDPTDPRTSQLGLNREQLYDSAKQNLLELGMTLDQIDQLEAAGAATSRMDLRAPIDGTVIEKVAVEGAYVKEGEALYRLADLSTVWLMLELFPEDAAAIHYGQQVMAELESLPGQEFSGRVAFVDPQVDPRTRTVGVRVVYENEAGVLRIGDYANARIDVPLQETRDGSGLVFDPELATKWISPRHPHIIEDAPGTCPLCGIDLIPAKEFGFADHPLDGDRKMTIPRRAVLHSRGHSIVYVEVQPGKFEIREVTLGPQSGDRVVVLEGLDVGEQVADRGNFLIDSQMQLSGNPSLIDPTKAIAKESPNSAEQSALEALSPEDRRLVEDQGICPVTEIQLGKMGTPIKIDVGGVSVFICCESCRSRVLEDADKYLEKLSRRKADSASNSADEEKPRLPGTSTPNVPPVAAPELFQESRTSAPAASPGNASDHASTEGVEP